MESGSHGNGPIHLQVFLWIGIKFLFTARGTEIVFFAFILTGKLRRFFINGHLADRVNCHLFTSGISLSLLLVYMF